MRLLITNLKKENSANIINMYLIFMTANDEALNPFLKKIVMRTLNPYEYYVAQTASIGNFYIFQESPLR